MNDKTARALAITALVSMAIFVISFPMSFMGTEWLYGTFMYIAIGSGAVTLLLFAVLKITGHGFSMNKINNEIEMKKIEEENNALIAAAAKEQAEKAKADDVPPDADATAPEENSNKPE